MFGATGVAAGSLYIPDPVVTKAVAAGAILFSGYAAWIYNRGGCLKLRVIRYGPPPFYITLVPGAYFGGYCR